jgi:hypothetical protein
MLGINEKQLGYIKRASETSLCWADVPFIPLSVTQRKADLTRSILANGLGIDVATSLPSVFMVSSWFFDIGLLMNQPVPSCPW